MKTYKDWHHEFLPKYEFNYFMERLTKLSKEKDLPAFMNSMRKLYKEEQDKMNGQIAKSEVESMDVSGNEEDILNQ